MHAAGSAHRTSCSGTRENLARGPSTYPQYRTCVSGIWTRHRPALGVGVGGCIRQKVGESRGSCAGQPKCSTTTSDVTTTTNSNDHGHCLRMSRIRAATCWICMFWMGACMTRHDGCVTDAFYAVRSPQYREEFSLPNAGLSLVTGNQPPRRARAPVAILANYTRRKSGN